MLGFFQVGRKVVFLDTHLNGVTRFVTVHANFNTSALVDWVVSRTTVIWTPLSVEFDYVKNDIFFFHRYKFFAFLVE